MYASWASSGIQLNTQWRECACACYSKHIVYLIQPCFMDEPAAFIERICSVQLRSFFQMNTLIRLDNKLESICSARDYNNSYRNCIDDVYPYWEIPSIMYRLILWVNTLELYIWLLDINSFSGNQFGNTTVFYNNKLGRSNELGVIGLL